MPVFDDAKPAVAAGGNATVALRLAEGFRRHGVTLTFGQSLPSAFHLACPHVGIEQKPYRQENAGGAMADGYARIARKVGIVTAQNGPAATLLVAPLAEALKASVPVLALVQEVTRDSVDRNAFQELDHLAMFAPVAKWVRRLDRADRLDDYVDMAFTVAASGRPGPAVLLVPADLLTEGAAPLSSLLRPRALSLGRVPLDPTETVVVPVPDTGKAAADAMAFALGIRSVEGLIRNRYIGRTFIEGANRGDKVRLKFTPLREVLSGKRVLLVEDSIVRSTTLKSLLHHLREQGGAKEVHVRVACPPILSPCFYGIDMSTVKELFAPKFMAGPVPTVAEQDAMAKELGADSLFYLPVDAVARCIGLPADRLCRACVTGEYPTPAGEKLHQLALRNHATGDAVGRTYEQPTEPLVCSVNDDGHT